MIELNDKQIAVLEIHLRHRLTLLRTLKTRRDSGFNYSGNGDLYRCVKDSNLIAVRLFLNFLGLKGYQTESGEYELKEYKVDGDDIQVTYFNIELVNYKDIPQSERVLLAGVYKRADKELAHFTKTINEEYNSEENLIQAAVIIERIIENYVYKPLKRPLPLLDS